MPSLEERVVAALQPSRVVDSVEESQRRFIVRAWLWAAPLVVLLLLMYLFHGWRYQVGVQVATLVSGAVLMAGVKRGWRARRVIDASLAVTVCTFTIGAHGQTPYDPSSIFMTAIVPMGAGFTGNFRRGVAWTVPVVLLGIGSLALGATGATWPDVDPSPTTTMSLNFVFLAALTLVFAKTFAEERHRALQQAHAADLAKSAFLANVSHEIRTPMNGVLGMTEVMLQQAPAPEQREQLEIIRRSGQAMVLLINDLLDLARVEAGRLHTVVARLELHTLVDDLTRLYGPLAEARGLGFTVTVGPGVPRAVMGDGLRLRQVLTNLLANAVKFTTEGRVSLRVDLEGPRVRFAVCDTGPGISPSLRPRLFHRFEQGDASSARRAGGTGLGLALSHELVQLMGGELVFDEAVEHGTCFRFSLALPLADEPVEPAPVAVPERLGGRVLIVDDNAVNLAVARSLVGRAGCEVHTAANGRQALEAAQASAWDLVLMDVQMPEMDGLEATRRIRALPGAAARVPIVALTASAMPTEVGACLEAGMNEVLAKPLNPQALVGALARHLAAGKGKPEARGVWIRS